jgi:iron complex outermembrane receptor protein
MHRQMVSLRLAAELAFALPPEAAKAQSRAAENAVTQAEDAFGFSIGHESLGLYDADNARGFSPSAAGNLRIDGLYFAPVVGLSGLVVQSTSVKVGLSAQGYPFGAPSGIVDQSLRRPGERLGASLLVNADSYGSIGAELDGSVPVLSNLALGIGLSGGRTHFADGTTNRYHSEALVGRWRLAPGVEITPFWSAFTDINDLSSPIYVPSGEFIPPEPRPGRYTGPRWNGINRTHFNTGVLGSVTLSDGWLLRFGVFRSIRHLRNGYTYLIDELQPTGVGRRILFANPQSKSRATSGEVRLTHTIAEGPRVHVLHFSLRGRRSQREFGGDDEADLGTSSIFEDVDTQRPVFDFGEQSHDNLRQWIYGFAYDGRWRSVGELSFGISKTAYRKSTVAPDRSLVARASPLLYNGTLTLFPLHGVAVYGGYSRGFEESGSPPANAANRSEALPAIITRQLDGGIRLELTPKLKAIAGLFDLSRPYFGFDQTNRYVPIGTTHSKGAEFSFSGEPTRHLKIVAGGVLLDATVQAPDSVGGTIGHRPVGIPAHLFSINANWDVAAVRGLAFDAALSHSGRMAATTDNAVQLPSRAHIDLGTRYSFSFGKTRATARFQVTNVFDNRGFSVNGPGAYSPNAARSASAQLTLDL